MGHVGQQEICVTGANLLSSRTCECVAPSVTCCLRNESKLEGVDGLRGSVSIQPIDLQHLLLLDNTLCNACKSVDEVCIFSCIDKNNDLISYYGAAQQLAYPNVQSSLYFSTAVAVELPVFTFEFDKKHRLCALLQLPDFLKRTSL